MEQAKDVASVNKLTKRTRKIQLEDHDLSKVEDVYSSFREHFHIQNISKFCKAAGTPGRRTPMCLFSDLFCDNLKVLCGLENGMCKPVDLNGLLLEESVTVDHQVDRSHTDLSCIRCSQISPHIFFTSSSSDGTIRQWDTRKDAKKPCQKFSTEEAGSSTSGGSKSKLKPLLQFDVSCKDQLLCGGTEIVDEDSYLLFWDTRSTKILGAYWESHSDDITAIRFHPDKIHSLATGSTDGLLNVFNLMEPAEEDALLYSFNTNSSVDRVHWYCPTDDDAKLACVTHSNEVQIWDSVNGDPVAEISRNKMAKAMQRSNPEAVYITSCHNLSSGKTSSVGVLANSLSGTGNMRLIQLNSEMQPAPLGIFMDQTAIVQTAQYIPTLTQWVTFDEQGQTKLWKSKGFQESNEEMHRPPKVLSKREERQSAKRYKPYNKD